MEDRDKIIEVLERIRAIIIEVQSKFSEAAEILNRKKVYDLSQLPGGKEIVTYINQNEQRDQNMQILDKSLTEYDKLIRDGDCIKDFITTAQAKFLNATRIVNHKYTTDLTENQLKEAQQEITQATFEIIRYNELLRRLYQVIGIEREL
ncbi:MAG: hypothetical protein AAB116_15805 [Candidatus Poribacteria bacterium]